MGIVSFAQNFEDVMLWRALGHVQNGFYIDVGAQHPVVDSVSKAFYERGWRGIHVEATPVYAELLRQDRPDETVLQVALAESNGTITFYEVPETGLSTGDANIAHGHREKGFTVRDVVVPCITLADVFAQAGDRDIHWLKIDVEGMEREVIASWGTSTSLPWILVVESTLPNTQIETHEKWESLLFARGYALAYFDGLNCFYVSEKYADLAKFFRAGPNVFDGFSLSGTAQTPFCSVVNQKQQTQQQAVDRLQQEKVEFQAQSEELERRLTLQVSAAEKESLRLSNRLDEEGIAHTARERALREQTDDLRKDCSRLAQMNADREKVFSEEIIKVISTTTREKLDLERFYNQKEGALRAELAARQQVIEEDLRIAQKNVHQLGQTFIKEKAELAGQLAAVQRQFALEKIEIEIEFDQFKAGLIKENLLHRDTVESNLSIAELALERTVKSCNERKEMHSREVSEYLDRIGRLEGFIVRCEEKRLYKSNSFFNKISPFSMNIGGIARIHNLVSMLNAGILAESRATNIEEGSEMNAQTKYQPQIKYQPSFEPNSSGIYDLDDLKSLYDRNFVRAAYLAILRREPDPEGEWHYLNKVRSGVSKDEILHNMLRSEEAKKHRTVVRGLKSSMALRAVCQVPFLGHIFYAVLFLFNIKSHLQDLRILENHVIRVAEESQKRHQDQLSQIHDSLNR